MEECGPLVVGWFFLLLFVNDMYLDIYLFGHVL